MKLSKYLIKSLLLVTAFGEKGLQKFVRSYPWVTLSKSKSKLRESRQTRKGL